jgi:hypothetical protein
MPQRYSSHVGLHKDCGSGFVLVADVAKFGFAMESFEFLNIRQTHGFSKVMGVYSFGPVPYNEKIHTSVFILQ